jgi:hypothetical protein
MLRCDGAVREKLAEASGKLAARRLDKAARALLWSARRMLLGG